MNNNIQIPEKIQNEVIMLDNKFDEHAANIQREKRKMEIAKLKMWDLICEHIPEANSSNCKINKDKISITIIDDKEMPDPREFLKGLLGGGM